jgi:Tol biopolymer transport system component
VYTVLADGSGLRNLTMNSNPDGNPVFSRDGTRIAFARSGAIFVMNADGTNQHAVAAGNGYTPRWSQNDTLIVFELWNGQTEADLWVVNQDGSGLRQLTSLSGLEVGASWSPDGARIAFQHQNDINIINADGTGSVNLTNDAALQYSPAWSTDGTKIAISEDGDIKTISPSGGARTPLSSGPDVDGLPIWSPDGTKIMFARLNSPTNSTRRIVIANADGTNAMAWGGPTDYVNSMAWVACP